MISPDFVDTQIRPHLQHHEREHRAHVGQEAEGDRGI